MKMIINLKIKLLKFLTLLFLLPSIGSLAPDTFQGFGLTVKAQNIDILLTSGWTLQDSDINGNSINLSVLGAFLYPDDFGDYSFEFNYGTTTCIESFKVNFTDVTETSFNLSTINEYVSCNYTDPDEITAVELYLSFYYELPLNTNSIPKNPFTYEWVDSGLPVEDLIITNPEGDWLLYRREFLSTPTFHQNSFTIYPNPVKENLSINNTSNQSVTATIYAVSGTALQSYTLEANTSIINVKSFNTGLYFVVFENESGEQVSKKFVKR
ncbi:MAG: T9SS type A sorting domain-containing protein [Flavobacteriaceae bacterium]